MAQRSKCENCGKNISGLPINIYTMDNEGDFFLCFGCFKKMSMRQLWQMELSKRHEKAASKKV